MPKTIRQSLTVRVGPKAVYDALMDSRLHSKFTGSKAVMSRRVGGTFTAYDGYASGKNLELVPAKKIVQTWRADDWPEAMYSKLTIRLHKTKAGTRLSFTQTGIPDRQVGAIKRGWIEFYWKPLKQILKK